MIYFWMNLTRYVPSSTRFRLSDTTHVLSKDGNGLISPAEFIATIRGGLSGRRKLVIDQAYDKLDRNSDGQVTVQDLQDMYDVSTDRRVQEGQCTAEECLSEFLSLWDTQEKDGIVSRKEFQDYYADLSAAVENDEEFEAIVSAAFALDS